MEYQKIANLSDDESNQPSRFTAADDATANNTDKKVIFKNCALFTSYISKINNEQLDNAEFIDIVMPMYNLI